ncbi:MAG TPA: DNA-processing protein DprA [Acidimicrobiales bacterium]|nr:DNA-processing protein DprA [Acidimicrobiales bacterium]
MTTVRLPPAAYAAALACLPSVGPGWLAQAVVAHGPESAWERTVLGQLGRPRRKSGGASATWADFALRFDVGALWEHCRQKRITVTWLGGPGYPEPLARSPSPAGVLFVAGDLGAVGDRPAVAVIGTRRCTPEGASVAYQLAFDLATAGVCVVSGLALGIDGAAHAGALAALSEARDVGGQPGPTVGVAASGVDVVYPRQHAAMWERVVSSGAVVSETPPRTPAQSWRFPSRNRIIAGLARMVVVVESHASGGSWHTVEAALRAGTEVGAVPGPVRSPASVGTNTLLHEGAVPVRNADDVLACLGQLRLGPPAPRRQRCPGEPRGQAGAHRMQGRGGSVPGKQAGGASGQSGTGSKLSVLQSAVLDGVGWQPRCLDEVAERAALPLSAVVVGLEELEELGLVFSEGGWLSRRQPLP